MINELYLIYQGLVDAGVDPDIKHNDIASPGLGTTFRVCLASDGSVDNVELLTKEKIKDTWSLGNGNKNQFPAIKFEYPFVPGAHAEYLLWKKKNRNPDGRTYRLMIQELLGQYEIKYPKINSWPSYRAKVSERKEKLEKELKNDSDGKYVYELFERFFKDGTEGLSVLDQIAHKLIDQAAACGEKQVLKAISAALFGDSIDKTGKVKDNRITILIDCLPQKDIDVYASSRSRVPSLSKALFAAEKSDRYEKGACFVTGLNQCQIVKGKFPSEKLSVVGETKLLAKSDTTSGPTVRRYEKAGTHSFCLSKLVGEKLAAAVAFLTEDERNGKTWRKIPSSSGASPSLLLAYCKGKFDLAITPTITGGDIEDIEDYENASATVLELFNKTDCSPDDVVEICEIRVLDKANRKVNYAISTSIGRLSVASREWMSACRNTPDFKLLSKYNKNENKMLAPWVIAPIEAIFLTKNKFIRQGASSTAVGSISFSDTMILFMSNSDRVPSLALRIIDKLANQVEPLFEYCALSKIQWHLPKGKQIFSTDTRKNYLALKTATLLAALFYKAGRKKEVYMNSFAYQLGQLCSAMDELHIGYCKDIRGGEIPNTLIGNIAYNSALQNPMKSMILLASRIKPYKSWAKKRRAKNQKTEDQSIIAGLAASVWIESHAAEVEKHFSKGGPSITDTYKAELMLGYLAGRPFNEKKK